MTRFEHILDRISALAADLKLAGLQPQLSVCRQQLNGNHSLDVAVFGRFKAGKSSFLNHLTGRDVLPIGVVPLTAVITRLRFGIKERAEVHFLNGQRREIPIDDIRLYVGEDRNPDNEKRVGAVEIELPALQPLTPLQFVDTPGLGSAFAHNTEATRDWLPNVGAALVAISSDAPLSERDLELLAELRRHTPKIVLLLTKADLLSESQRMEVLAFVRKQLLDKWQTELPVFFYSVRDSERELKRELEEQLLQPLVRNCAVAASQIAQHKLLSLLAQTLNYVRVAVAAATQAESARAALRDKLADESRHFDLLRAELGVLSRQWTAEALDWYLSQLRSTQQALQTKITEELERQFPRWKMRLPLMLDAWRTWLDSFLNRELGEISSSHKRMFCEPLHRAQVHLTRTLRAFHDRLAEHVKSALNVTLRPHEFALEVREPPAPPVNVAYAFDAAFTTVGWLIPLSIFRPLIERQLLRKARYEVEKNLSRLSADWRDRMARAVDELIRQAENQAREELGALEQTLAQTASQAPELNQAVQELEQFEQSIREDVPQPKNSANGVMSVFATNQDTYASAKKIS